MFRWIILLATLGAWLACMRLVYVHYGPQDTHAPVPADRKTLDNLFDEALELNTAWEIYVRPSEINDNNMIPFAGLAGNEDDPAPKPRSGPGPGAAPVKHAPWSGHDESGLVHVGRLDESINRKFTRAEVNSEWKIFLPPEIHALPLLRQIHITGRSSYTQEQGLDQCAANIAVGDLIEVSAVGTRNRDEMIVTKEMTIDKKQVSLQQGEHLPVGDRSAPGTELLLFQRNKDVQVNVSWNIVMLDVSSLDLNSSEPKMMSVKVACTGKTQIRHGGTTATVFEVSNEDGSARAWYSADGIVLKQTFPFLGLFPIYAVRVMPRHGRARVHIAPPPED